MKRLKIYLDTSVIGGCLDVEFALESNRLIKDIKQQKITMLLSELIINELIDALSLGLMRLFLGISNI